MADQLNEAMGDPEADPEALGLAESVVCEVVVGFAVAVGSVVADWVAEGEGDPETVVVGVAVGRAVVEGLADEEGEEESEEEGVEVEEAVVVVVGETEGELEELTEAVVDGVFVTVVVVEALALEVCEGEAVWEDAGLCDSCAEVLGLCVAEVDGDPVLVLEGDEEEVTEVEEVEVVVSEVDAVVEGLGEPVVVRDPEGLAEALGLLDQLG